ncbi:hypothetical protein AT728_12165 [Streptomyces silvensis]|uniref:Uncharacterized protein n=1 Tax=Streptomyces silvensis TaxID=1765722 RepID=A0A0W7X124_9ACTN|nr:hypothetical protein AT728_12165 [Streptomyces silvensis]
MFPVVPAPQDGSRRRAPADLEEHLYELAEADDGYACPRALAVEAAGLHDGHHRPGRTGDRVVTRRTGAPEGLVLHGLACGAHLCFADGDAWNTLDWHGAGYSLGARTALTAGRDTPVDPERWRACVESELRGRGGTAAARGRRTCRARARTSTSSPPRCAVRSARRCAKRPASARTACSRPAAGSGADDGPGQPTGDGALPLTARLPGCGGRVRKGADAPVCVAFAAVCAVPWIPVSRTERMTCRRAGSRGAGSGAGRGARCGGRSRAATTT